jgi:hypothetical protein
METVSTKVSGERGVSLHTSYTMDALETSYFVQDPPLEELEARLKVPRVQAVLKSGRIPSLRQPVYMVTGQMVAKGFAAQQDRAKNLSGEVEASASVPTPGGEVGLGASIGASSSMEDSDSWKTSEDIVFAYQLLRIELKGWKGTRIEYDEFRHKAAYLGKEDSEDDGDDDGQGDDDEDTVQVVAIRADVDNMPISRHAGKVETVELGEGETKITCISTIDT